ncbi:STAS/SEC14 domain-containing protein [Pontibacter liquoris]|uniref:STAS/SEC14 domain-containing protein n=1 Tax=Pontibacter liquoris TaxID=2905677 RepID=UPI001FA7EE36|nr:STAS/SEC14 domain-containing protein [Pontibacter liquoris]
MVTIYFQSPAFTLRYDSEHALGLVTTVGFLSSEEFREATIVAAQMMDEYKPLRWLADNRKMRAIRQADQEWFAAYILPKLQTGSIRRNATVVSEDIFNKMAVEQFLKRADNLGDLVLKEFDDLDEALDWVKQPIPFQAQG